ncbi:Rhomboid domain-containing protein [Lachancea thermotolerans]|uniref:KLTH0E05390p n=1 Tax=Lachancea thermotolerans (strain ATCC 56472 / CBS 6340 / NRRL Y-8284) TaxID=559295 RepID=C5DHL7_LACTC|nr:KLTH0E05390p [Lachancea thermotolerans CBS 6340]CAR23278.1 KLTH0E05390p [Lachancea thermotolerans CBS 6340]
MNSFVSRFGKHFFLSNAINIQTKPLSASILGPLGLNLRQRIPTQPARFFSRTSEIKSSWRDVFNGAGASRYARLNRFQQFEKGSRNTNNPFSNNSLRNVTIAGALFMGGTYFGLPYLFDNVPPFTYFRAHPSSLVYGLIGLNCGVFALWRVPQCWRFLQRYMLLEKDHIYSKWSLIGSAFSHQEVWHLGMNMLALWSFGTTVATMLGPANFMSLYLNSALAGSLLSLWYPRIARISMMAPSLGASGALFGVFGCFSYLIPHAKIMLFVFPIPGGAWLAFLGSMVWNAAGCALRWGSFDYAAHLGGSVAGIVYAYLISEQLKKEKARRMQRFSVF